MRPALPSPLPQNNSSVGVAVGFKILQEAAYRTRHRVSLCQSPHAQENMYILPPPAAGIQDLPPGARGRGKCKGLHVSLCNFSLLEGTVAPVPRDSSGELLVFQAE